MEKAFMLIVIISFSASYGKTVPELNILNTLNEYSKQHCPVLYKNVLSNGGTEYLSTCRNVTLNVHPHELGPFNLKEYLCVGILDAELNLCDILPKDYKDLPKNFDELKKQVEDIQTLDSDVFCQKFKTVPNVTDKNISLKPPVLLKWVTELYKNINSNACIKLCSGFKSKTNNLCSLMYVVNAYKYVLIKAKSVVEHAQLQTDVQDVTRVVTSKEKVDLNHSVTVNNPNSNSVSQNGNIQKKDKSQVLLKETGDTKTQPQQTSIQEKAKSDAIQQPVVNNTIAQETQNVKPDAKDHVGSIENKNSNVKNDASSTDKKTIAETSTTTTTTTKPTVVPIETITKAAPVDNTIESLKDTKQNDDKKDDNSPPEVNPDNVLPKTVNKNSDTVVNTDAKDDVTHGGDDIDQSLAKQNEDNYNIDEDDDQVKESGSMQSVSARNLPEDEDSNFFSYFMFISVIFIAGYVIYHNKQKILALLLEGRRDRNSRRRPNTASYRKLNSNLEEAVTSKCSGSASHVIY